MTVFNSDSIFRLRLVVYADKKPEKGVGWEIIAMFHKNFPAYAFVLPILNNPAITLVNSFTPNATEEKLFDRTAIELGIFVANRRLGDLQQKLEEEGWDSGD